jgi:hypothetical protein
MADLHDLRELIELAHADNTCERWDAIDKLLDENLVCMGLGGEQFVFGNYESIKACQSIIFGKKS